MKTTFRVVKAALLLGLLLVAGQTSCQADQRCGNGERLSAGSNFWLRNNVWNPGAAGTGWSQCIWNSSSQNSWGFDWDFPDNGFQGVKSFPHIQAGWDFDGGWIGPRWRSQINSKRPITTSWNALLNGFSGHFGEGTWNMIYDIWTHPTSTPGNAWNGSKPSAEIIVLLARGNTFGGEYGNVAKNISLAGATWNVHYNWIDFGNGMAWPLFSFQRTSRTTSVSNLNLMQFIDWLHVRNRINGNDYVTAVHAGFEICNGKGSPDITNWSLNVTSS